MAKRDDGLAGSRKWLLGAALWPALACTAQVQAESKTSGRETSVAPGDEKGSSTESSEQADEASEKAGSASQATSVAASASPGRVTFVYRRRQITACGMIDQDGERVCAAKSEEEHRGKAEITLTPIDEDDEVDSTRSDVVLQFDQGKATQSREVELGKGRWELEWKGESTARDRFKVVSEDRFEIALDGIAGVCAMEGNACKLQAQKTQQVIELPEARGLH